MDAHALALELLNAMKQNRLNGHHEENTNPLGADYFVLQYLDQHPDVTPSELSQALNVTTARISVIVRRLEKNAMITRSMDPTDLRKFIINLTPLGQATLKKQEDNRLRYLTNMMAYLGEEDAKTYIRIINKLAQRDNKQA